MLNMIVVACLILAVAVALGSASKLTTKILFVMLCGCLALWAPSIQWFLFADDLQQKILAAKIFYFVTMLFGAALFVFANHFPREDRSRLIKMLPPVLALSLPMLMWIASSDRFIIQSVSAGMVDVDKTQYMWFSVLFVFFFFGAVATNIYKYMVYKGAERSQIIWYTAGIALTSIPGFYGNLYLPYFGNYSLIWIGPIAVSVFLIMTFYSIIRHSMFDIRLAAVRTLAYALSLLAMSSVYFGLAYIASLTLFNGTTTTGVSMSPINIILALILAFIFQPIKKFFDRITDKVFFRDRYDTNDFISRLGRVLTSTTVLDQVLECAGSEIRSTLKSSGYLFFVYRDHRPDVVVGEGLKRRMGDDDYATFHRLTHVRSGRIIVLSDIAHSRDREERRLFLVMAKHGITLALPLISNDAVIGFLLLGEQKAGGYAKRDIEVLETIADELVIAIQNARSVQVVRDLNTHLEQRVSAATRELRATNKRLIELDATKDEFVSMASHQLRTPLTSIKGYLSMVLEGDVGDITPDQRQLLGEAFTSSERMVHLIGDFLNVSRLQTGKFMIEYRETDLAKLVEQEVESMRQIAGSHDKKIVYRVPQVFPHLFIDDNKLRQVVMNFLDNAMYYSPDSRAPIVVRLGVEDGDAVLRIMDKGMGVPQDVQKQLFTKFFRADNARKQRPDGTGIGLYLAKKIIDGHGGQLIFESVEDKGSTFGFRLPIKKLSKPPKPDNTKNTP